MATIPILIVGKNQEVNLKANTAQLIWVVFIYDGIYKRK